MNTAGISKKISRQPSKSFMQLTYLIRVKNEFDSIYLDKDKDKKIKFYLDKI